jgi:hypothetical protein
MRINPGLNLHKGGVRFKTNKYICSERLKIIFYRPDSYTQLFLSDIMTDM